jgi:asparagine synthase (glutamine-hydrolysing)
VDWEFFRTIAAIPPHLRFAPGKQLLVDAAGGLPSWITSQPKRGFLFPFEKWSSHLWKNDRSSDHGIHPEQGWPWYQCWAVTVLNDWMRRNKVRP